MARCARLLIVASLFVAGCGDPVLDTKDLDDSIADLRDSVDESRRPAFDAAIGLVRLGSAGKVTGTEPFALDGMTAAAVLAEAERIEIRRDRALEQESVAAHREILGAEERLSKLKVTGFLAQPIGETRMEADVTVRNELDFAVETAWLVVEVAIPGGASLAGEEFVSFQPPLRAGETRPVHIQVLGEEARSLPVEPPAELRCRFSMVERGGQVVLQAPSAELRRKAEADVAAAEKRIADLDARLAAVQAAK